MKSPFIEIKGFVVSIAAKWIFIGVSVNYALEKLNNLTGEYTGRH